MIRPKRAKIQLSKVAKIQKFLWWGPPYKRLQNQATLGSSIFGVDGFLLTCLFHKMKKKNKTKKKTSLERSIVARVMRYDTMSEVHRSEE